MRRSLSVYKNTVISSYLRRLSSFKAITLSNDNLIYHRSLQIFQLAAVREGELLRSSSDIFHLKQLLCQEGGQCGCFVPSSWKEPPPPAHVDCVKQSSLETKPLAALTAAYTPWPS